MIKVEKVAIIALAVAISLCTRSSFAGDDPNALPELETVSAPDYAVSPPGDFVDVRLAAAATPSGQSIAVNPKNGGVFLAAFAAGGSCWIRASTNAGRTWAAAKRLPMPTGTSNCIAPAVTWAPDGSRVYAAYVYTGLTAWEEAVVSFSTNNGVSWSPPQTAQQFTGTNIPVVKLAAPLRASDAKWVYLVSLQYPTVYLTRSSDQGKTWSAKQELVSCGGRDEYVSDPSIAGGPNGEVLVSWGSNYCGGTTKQQIEVRRSSNFGSSFSPAVVAVPGNGGRTATAFGAGGTAHLVYIKNYAGSDGPNYVFSTKAPYTLWSAPVRLNDSVSVAGISAPALSVSNCGSSTSVLHVVWMDERVSPGAFNTYYTRKVAKTGEPWSANLRISGSSVTSSIGLESGIAAGVTTAAGIWGSRPVWASRIAPGVSCP